LLDAADDPETHCILAVMLICGLRRSEALGLAFDAIDLERATLAVRRSVVAVAHKPVERSVGKTEASKRVLAIPPELVSLLRAQKARVTERMLQWGPTYKREPLYVFANPDGSAMIPQALTERLKAVMRRAGVKGAQPCHAWRHTAATLLLDSGANVRTIAARLGHSTPSITLQLYVHPVTERDVEAAAHLGKLIER
jgi:integrase